MTARNPDKPGYGKLTEKTPAGLIAEWRFWNEKLLGADEWGGANAAAWEFREDVERLLRRRGIDIPQAGEG